MKSSLAKMFSSIPQGAGELFSSDDEMAEFCVGTLTKAERLLALIDIRHLLSLSDKDQFAFWNSLDAEVVMRSPKHAAKFTGLLHRKLEGCVA